MILKYFTILKCLCKQRAYIGTGRTNVLKYLNNAMHRVRKARDFNPYTQTEFSVPRRLYYVV